MASDYDSSDDSSSSSSDDEFLTTTGTHLSGEQDREALIRKKLLESFYGTSAVSSPKEEPANDAGPSSAVAPSNEASASAASQELQVDQQQEESRAAASRDLDSPYFDAAAHTSRHVQGSSVHTLLETEERLSLEVRTLDSTMQTLVYENYSKFIDATDAIRSIGVSVNANEEGLARLETGMQTIDEQSQTVEDALGTLRDAVAEKLRVRRLLHRLDALLKLPTTLQHQIASGKYRLAAKSHFSATQILGKHSAGFESLRSIETECHAILTEMVQDLRRKLLHWSGQDQKRSGSFQYDDMQDEEDDDDEEEVDVSRGSSTAEWEVPPKPPQNVAEIFECAGTLLLLSPKQEDQAALGFDSGLSPHDCKSIALASCKRLLNRVLDAHHIEWQEAQEEAMRPKLGKLGRSDEARSLRQISLIPTAFLDGILEAATLYGVSFESVGAEKMEDTDCILLGDFVSEVFATFLGHVRMALLEQSLSDQHAEDTDEHDEGDAAYVEVSAALTHLVRSVRELASGLALPEVGLDVEVASSLVDQTVEVTESMVRRRVAQKFRSLRIRVLQECVAPFARDAAIHPADSGPGTARVVQIVQMASVALSDGMQLVDDTIRNILSGGGVLGSPATPVDSAMVKLAVQTNAHKLAMWLASTLEVVAGCDPCDATLTIDVTDDDPAADTEEGEDDVGERTNELATDSTVQENMSEASDDHDEDDGDEVDTKLRELLAQLEEEASVTAYSDLTLAISEMCRLAERSVTDNVNQSIASSTGNGKKASSKADGIFNSSMPSLVRRISVDADKRVSVRFRLAASRVLALYAMNRGADAATVACGGFCSMASQQGDVTPTAPRSAAWQVLEVAKLTSLDCAQVFGGRCMAGPVPPFPESDRGARLSPSHMTSLSPASSLGGHMTAIKGLQLDVERMFTEKVHVYPQSFQLTEFTRNEVVATVLKVAFKAMMEQTRACTFTTSGYHQLQVDIEFLRHMVPHFVKDDFMSDGTNASTSLYNLLNDVMLNAGERCLDLDCVGTDEFYDVRRDMMLTPRVIVRQFMTPDESEEGGGITSRFTILDD